MPQNYVQKVLNELKKHNKVEQNITPDERRAIGDLAKDDALVRR